VVRSSASRWTSLIGERAQADVDPLVLDVEVRLVGEGIEVEVPGLARGFSTLRTFLLNSAVGTPAGSS